MDNSMSTTKIIPLSEPAFELPPIISGHESLGVERKALFNPGKV